MSWKVFSIQTDWTCGKHQPFLWVLLGTQAPHQLTAIHIKSYFRWFCVKKYILPLSQVSTVFFLLHFYFAFKKRFFNSNILKIKLSCGSFLAANHHTSQKQRALNYCSHQIVFLLIRFGFSLILFCIFAHSIRDVLQLYCSIPWFNLIYIICYPWISICALP